MISNQEFGYCKPPYITSTESAAELRVFLPRVLLSRVHTAVPENYLFDIIVLSLTIWAQNNYEVWAEKFRCKNPFGFI